MNIKGLSGLTSFVNQNGLANIDGDLSLLCRCVEEYKRLCECDPPNVKSTKLNTCTTYYMNFIKRINQFKNQFMSKTSDTTISFYSDSNQRLSTISR